MQSAASQPRVLALEVIRRVLAPKARVFAQDLLDERLAALATRDRGLAADLTYGVIRRRATLDAVINAHADRELEAIDPLVCHILRLGVYQLLYHERVPQHAAVDQSVALTRSVGKAGAAGFVNGVLRAIARGVVFGEAPDPEQPRRSFALARGRACVFGRDILPPPSATAAYLAAAHSYSPWLVERWLARYGRERAEELCVVCNEPGPLFLRANIVRNSPGELLERLAAEGVAATLSASGRTVCLPRHVRAASLASVREGLCLVQDDSSAAVARFLGPRAGESVLDLCAAPGGKTCHLAELMGNRGEVVAVDASGERLKRVVENADRLGHTIIRAVAGDAGEFALGNRGRFDRVLLDAPCSNSGVLRRRVEVRWRLSDGFLASVAAEQRRLLEAAAASLKAGGTLVYSTCSLAPEENGAVVRAVVRAAGGVRLDAEEQIMPSAGGGDGIFMARLLRSGPGGGGAA